MTLPISYFRFYFPEYVLKTRLPPNCATGFLDSLRGHALHGPFSVRKAGGNGHDNSGIVKNDGVHAE